MAKPVTVSWTTTSQLVVNGSRFTQYRVTVSSETTEASVMAPFGATEATVPDVPAGTYVAAVELVNADGSEVGPGMVSDTFDHFDDVDLDVPTRVSAASGEPA